MQIQLSLSSFVGERRITDCSEQAVVPKDIWNENYICELILFCFYALQTIHKFQFDLHTKSWDVANT